MRHKIKMPKLGDTAGTVVIVEWSVDVGDKVAEGDTLVTVETDKVGADVPSPLAGTVVEHLVAPDDEVAVGAPIAIVES